MVEFRHSDIIGDPGDRKPIDEHPQEIRDQLRRAYALGGPTQPSNYTFPRKWQSGVTSRKLPKINRALKFCFVVELEIPP